MKETMKFVISAALGFLTVTATVAATVLVFPLSSAAQEATPEASDALPPLVWQLTTIETDTNSPSISDPDRYTIQFLPSGRMAIGADCNRGLASFEINGSELWLNEIATTMALCDEDSRSGEFLAALEAVNSFSIDRTEATDQLILALASGGALRFSPSLVGVIWQWDSFQGGDGSVISPDEPAKFALEFQADGTVTGQIDCNRAMGTYTVDGSSIAVVLATTRMFCGENSRDADFGRFVAESTSFVIRDGNLSIALPMDGGITTFTPVYDDPFAATDEPDA